jgi:hypothetical protein
VLTLLESVPMDVFTKGCIDMRMHLPMFSPYVRHEGKDDDIFGPILLVEADSGFWTLKAEEI